MGERVCPECGSDRWKVQAFDRLSRRAEQLGRDVERLARENGLLIYQLRAAKDEVAVLQSSLQRKIVRQARAIVRLERKLRARGERPHEGAQPGDAVGGHEYDAATALAGKRERGE